MPFSHHRFGLGFLVSQKWLGAQIRVFPPDAFEEACDFLEIAPTRRAKLYELMLASKMLLVGTSSHRLSSEDATASTDSPGIDAVRHG